MTCQNGFATSPFAQGAVGRPKLGVQHPDPFAELKKNIGEGITKCRRGDACSWRDKIALRVL
jgi:hypothetical protein